MRTLTVSALLVALGSTASAQTGSSPPSYGASALAGAEIRVMRTFQLNVGVKVPKAELQALLPDGYTAQDLGDGTSRLTFAVYFQQRVQLLADLATFKAGSYGPADVMNVMTVANHGSAGTVTLILDSERSTDLSADLANAIFGAGSARVASRLDVNIDEKSESRTIRYHAHVQNHAIHQNIDIDVVASSAIDTPLRAVVAATPFRFLNGAQPPAANRPFRNASSADYVALGASDIDVDVPGGTLSLPEGSLTVLGVDASAPNRLNRWLEVYIKLD